MGLLDALAGGVESAATTGTEAMMKQFAADIETERAERLAEFKHNMDVSAAQTERERVAGIIGNAQSTTTTQPNAAVAQGAGANSADDQGADENIGVDVQKRPGAPSIADKVKALVDSGDLAAAKELAATDKTLSYQDLYYAGLISKERNADKRLEGVKYTADQRLEGTELMAEARKQAKAAGVSESSYMRDLRKIQQDELERNGKDISLAEAMELRRGSKAYSTTTETTDGKGNVIERKKTTRSGASTPEVDNFVVGKTYKDKNGNTATYLGNGKWSN